MRQVGSLSNESDAQRFAAYLVADGVDAHAEEEQGGWNVWVRDENHLEAAKAELARFLEDPSNSRYQDAEQSAAARRREEERRREKARGNVVEMRGRWGRGGAMARRCPLTITLIVLSVLVGITSNLGYMLEPVMNQLTFCRLVQVEPGSVRAPIDGFTQIKQGQLWRAITPIFIHFGVPHLVFNMFALYYYGAQVEDRRGTWRLGLMVLVIAVISNVAQYLWSGNPYFGGMSGVGYGLFGFVWMRMLHDRGSGLHVSPLNVFIMVGFFLLCIARDVGPFTAALAPVVERVANTAHTVGLLLGMAIGYFPVALRSRRLP